MKNMFEKITALMQRGAVTMQLNRPKFRKQRGASAIEYVVIAAVIALAVFVGSELGLADAFKTFFEKVKTAVNFDNAT
ncbi:Flp family type IVb pilin [Halomonas sp. NCCP-2165]|nr:Flp family type IVb pilin [Halomonas sp. NCCP-2165]GKW50338.1 hypothetical protein NCCP2165_25530 [Halomonas sp. NCCP-2165]